MISLSWMYKNGGRQQTVLCHSEQEAKAIKRFVKRNAGDLEPCGFTEVNIDQSSAQPTYAHRDPCEVM